MDNLKEVLEIARDNTAKNPSLQNKDVSELVTRYLSEINNEVEEVRMEVKENNSVYLTDELSDIIWDYFTLLSILEKHNLIDNAESVFEAGYKKYSERAPAFLEESGDLWEEVKNNQKLDLQKRHEEKYGN